MPTKAVRTRFKMAEKPLFAILADAAADAVIVGCVLGTREIVADPALIARLALEPKRQPVGAQCSGTLIVAKLGRLGHAAACTDLTSKRWVQAAGVEALDQPFHAQGDIATAGGCLASPWLAAWIIARTAGPETAAAALRYVAPVGENEVHVARAMGNIEPCLAQ